MTPSHRPAERGSECSEADSHRILQKAPGYGPGITGSSEGCCGLADYTARGQRFRQWIDWGKAA